VLRDREAGWSPAAARAAGEECCEVKALEPRGVWLSRTTSEPLAAWRLQAGAPQGSAMSMFLPGVMQRSSLSVKVTSGLDSLPPPFAWFIQQFFPL
jgi:hypothetical protein